VSRSLPLSKSPPETTGVLPALLTINNGLLPAGPAQGIISACLQPGVVQPPAAGSLDDRPYYANVQNLVNFY
jgi:hypothetical protein